MRDNYILTAESVTEGHPDKLCDTIADSVLDACLKNDPAARVACEVMATAGKIIVAGEIAASKLPDIHAIVCRTVRETSYGADYEVEAITHDQSGDIAGAVAQDAHMGAGDQGIVYGFACSETAELLPLPVVLAHRLTLLLTNARKTGTIQGLGPDGKAQVSVEYQNGKPHRIAAVVVSCQHDTDKNLDELRQEITRHVIVPALRDLYPDHKTEVFINPSGRFVLGGFEADTGLTGRKLMVDTYGGLAPHGGGALSGKDGSKVDRSGAYMARYIAKNIVAAGLAEQCTVSLAYAIGRAKPVAMDIDAYQTGRYPEAVLEQAVRAVFDLTPSGMIRTLGLNRPIFARFCNYGHFTHQDAPWEQTNQTAALVDACVSISGNGGDFAGG
jgi:S-adenosylmethionine synthetase